MSVRSNESNENLHDLGCYLEYTSNILLLCTTPLHCSSPHLRRRLPFEHVADPGVESLHPPSRGARPGPRQPTLVIWGEGIITQGKSCFFEDWKCSGVWWSVDRIGRRMTITTWPACMRGGEGWVALGWVDRYVHGWFILDEWGHIVETDIGGWVAVRGVEGISIA